MTRIRIAVVCLFLVGLLAVPAAPAQAGAGRTMIRKINNVRQNHGLRPVRRAPSLARSARRYARVMMSRDFFGHGSRIRAPRRFSRRGEALAMMPGYRPRTRRTLRMWLRSPGHRALVLSPAFRFMGAGYSRGRFRGRRATIWVLHLGSR
jgi:uncharacterized protein YkwD